MCIYHNNFAIFIIWIGIIYFTFFKTENLYVRHFILINMYYKGKKYITSKIINFNNSYNSGKK